MESIKNRRTIRKYTNQDISSDFLNTLLEEASRAATMGNLQLYSVIITRDSVMKDRLSPIHFNQPMVKNAPVVLTFCADFRRVTDWCNLRKAHPGYENFLSFLNAAIDTLLFTQNFCTLAEDKGLGTCFLGTKIKELYPNKRVLYVSAHLFQVQYTDSVRKNTTNDFINFYQTIDVLIIDDIQEFANLTKTQNTFFHIFNHLHQNNKQLIFTSDRSPIMLQGLEDRLLTRFKWGLQAEMEKPNTELRKDILVSKMHRDGLRFPEDVVNYIAENVNDSVRDLEGIVNSLMAYSMVYNHEIDLCMTERIIKKIKKTENKEITIDNIIKAVCQYYNVEENCLHAKSRKKDVVLVRQVAMYFSKIYTNNSLAKIGQAIGGKDHATVLHAFKIIKNQSDVDKAFKKELLEIENSIKN